jgi:hypothetical protein
MRRTMKAFFVLWAAIVAGCGGWSAPEAGPVPLGPPGTTIERLKREKPTFSHTITDILWNDGRARWRRMIGSRQSWTRPPSSCWID